MFGGGWLLAVVGIWWRCLLVVILSGCWLFSGFWLVGGCLVVFVVVVLRGWWLFGGFWMVGGSLVVFSGGCLRPCH